MSREIIYWLWYSLKFPAGCEAAFALLSYYNFNIRELYKGKEEDYRRLCGKDFKYTEALCDKSLDEAGMVYEFCRTGGYDIITVTDKRYPSRLVRIDKRPILLYCKGTLPDIDSNLTLGVVGTRRMTAYGRRSTYMICFDLARCGAIIVSGAASGIDGVAARAAIDAGGKTVAVLGCGIDVSYPQEHFELIDEIANYGAVITEYPPHTKPLRHNFPMRNRIISGLSLGVWVVEADLKSGSLITADYARRQGRDLFALPGRVGEMNSLGTNELIKQGAKIITHAEDVLCEYDSLFPEKITSNVDEALYFDYDLPFPHDQRHIRPNAVASVAAESTISDSEKMLRMFYLSEAEEKMKKTPVQDNIAERSSEQMPAQEYTRPSPTHQKKSKGLPKGLSEKERAVCKLLLSDRPMSADEIASTGIPISDVTVALTVLELKKIVKSLPGGKFILL